MKKKRTPKRGSGKSKKGISSPPPVSTPSGSPWIPSAAAVSDSSLKNLVYAPQYAAAGEWSSGGGGGGGGVHCGPWFFVRTIATRSGTPQQKEREVQPWIQDGPATKQPDGWSSALVTTVNQRWHKKFQNYTLTEVTSVNLYSQDCIPDDGGEVFTQSEVREDISTTNTPDSFFFKYTDTHCEYYTSSGPGGVCVPPYPSN